MTIPSNSISNENGRDTATDVPFASSVLLDSKVPTIKHEQDAKIAQIGASTASAYAVPSSVRPQANTGSLVYHGSPDTNSGSDGKAKCGGRKLFCIVFWLLFLGSGIVLIALVASRTKALHAETDKPDNSGSYLPWRRIGEIHGYYNYERSGTTVALSEDGSIVAIESPKDGKRGRVQICIFSNGRWALLGDEITGTSEPGFETVSLSSDGKIVAISSPLEVGVEGTYSVVRVYEYLSLVGWEQIGLNIGGESFGFEETLPVSLSGNGTVLLVGGSFGQAQVHELNEDGEWNQRENIETVQDHGVTSVSLSSDGAIAVIAYVHLTEDSGFVRVYKYDQGEMVQLGDDIVYNHGRYYRGYRVSASFDGNIIAIGLPAAQGNKGTVHVLEYDDTSGWNQLGNEIVGEWGHATGTSLSLSSDGTVLAVGSPDSTTGNAKIRSGHVGVFEFADGKWERRGVNIDGEWAYDLSGTSVSLSGDGSRVAIGAPYNGPDHTGQVRVYEYN